MKKILFVVLAVLMIIAGLAGCADKQPKEDSTDGEGQYEQDDGQANTGNEPSKFASISYPKAIAFGNHEAQLEVFEQNAVDDNIINSINEFSADSASTILQGKTDNVCYSPLSLYMVMAMLSTGAKGETQDEILDLLNETDTEYLSEQMGKLFRLMYRDNEMTTFFMANSLWINSNFGVKQEYVDYTMEHFYAGANVLDFDDKNAGDAISGWISDNTKGLLEPEIKTQPQEILYIVNTIYLKDAWVHTFDKDATKTGEFTLADGSMVETEFMHNSFDGDVAYGSGFTAIDLRLTGGGKMTFVLPDEGIEINSFLSDPELLKSMTNRENTEYATINMSLPKFDFKSDFDLKERLIDLGVVKAFDSKQADLSDITELPETCLSKVNQGTKITVNEDGLEAAAYTYAALVNLSCPSKTIDISFNRPFIFIVSSNEGVPVFIGVVQNPNK